MANEETGTKHPESKPVVASYVSDFLKPDMLHVHRQITGLQAVKPWVLTHKRENTAQFPFPDKRLIVLPKPRLRWWRRWVSKHVKREPWQLFRWELRHALLELTRAEAKVLHVYFGHSAIHLRPLIKAFPRPVLVSFHGADAGVDMDKPAHLAALREVFESATIVQARSASLMNDLENLGCPREKLRLQSTGIPLEDWTYQSRPSENDQPWRILQSCRLIEKKGVDLTLRAFAKVLPTYPGAELVIAGSGPQQDELERLAGELGLSSRVRFTGFLNQAELREEVYRARMFVHPSRTSDDGNREGIPNSMLEAMASGAPVVATHHGGIPEAVTDGGSGLLVPENDADALAAAMLRIMEDNELARRLAEGGRRVVENKFDRVANIRILESCYLEMIAAD
ncbi:MAG: glycosyltransferase [Verrucomicrobia bacterium]|nr:glycosyltransferase [Verrucomicrobiota bacterium]